VAHESGDTVYGLDRQVEAVIVETMESWDDGAKPLLVVAEGMGEDGREQSLPVQPSTAATLQDMPWPVLSWRGTRRRGGLSLSDPRNAAQAVAGGGAER
jgi:hypothetical protein